MGGSQRLPVWLSQFFGRQDETAELARLVEDVRSAGADASYGRKAPRALEAAGLGDVDAEGVVMTWRAPEVGPCFLPVLDRLREHLISAGLVTAAELDHIAAELNDDESTHWFYPPLMVSARGRRPSHD